MEWLVSWKKPSWEEAERREEGFWAEREMRGGERVVVVVGGGERREGRERVGGRRWRRRDRTSEGSDEVERGLGCWVDGVGGGAAVAARCRWL